MKIFLALALLIVIVNAQLDRGTYRTNPFENVKVEEQEELFEREENNLNDHVNNLLQTSTNTAPGWNINVDYGKWSNLPTSIKAKCGPSWYGWDNWSAVGTISTTLYKQKQGRKNCGRLDFGNCWNNGTVRVYLDGQLVGEAHANTPSKIIEFPIVEDSLLEIKDEGPASIIRINDFEMVECSECCCEAALYKYSYPGVVPLGKGDVVWTTNYWARQFMVEFDIQVTEELTDLWHNIFHMTIGENKEKYGDRIPAVWVNKAKYFLIASAMEPYNSYHVKYNYTLNQWYHIEISQKENSNGEIIYSTEIDGTIVNEAVNTRPQRFEKVILYTSDPWYPSFASFGELKDLNIVNLDKFPA